MQELGIPEIAAVLVLISARVAFTDKFVDDHSCEVKEFTKFGEHPFPFIVGQILFLLHVMCVSIIMASVPAGMVWLVVKFVVKFI